MVNVKYAAQFKSEGFVFLALSPGLVDTKTTPRTCPREFLSNPLLTINSATPDEVEELSVMIEKFRILYPDFAGPITPEVSVQMQLEVINRVTVRDTGAFISHKGNKEWL